jgi:hypothetical protein
VPVQAASHWRYDVIAACPRLGRITAVAVCLGLICASVHPALYEDRIRRLINVVHVWLTGAVSCLGSRPWRPSE